MKPMDLSIIQSRDNRWIKRAAKLLSSKKARREEGLFVAEGLRLCEDALRSGLLPQEIFVTQEALPRCQQLLEATQRRYLISEELAARLGDTQTPQGVFCVFPTLDNARPLDTMKGQRLMLLSSLQDPGNLGTIVRSGEAFGIDGLILSEDCPDLYAPKVLRATMGGVFRLPIQRVPSMVEAICDLRRQGFAVYGAALSPESIPVQQLDLRGKVAIVIGNEGNGLSPQVLAACTAPLIIPMAGKAESLNAAVAASVLLWELSRPRD